MSTPWLGGGVKMCQIRAPTMPPSKAQMSASQMGSGSYPARAASRAATQAATKAPETRIKP